MTALVVLAVIAAYVVIGVAVVNRGARALDMDVNDPDDAAALGAGALIWPVIVLLAALSYLVRLGSRR